MPGARCQVPRARCPDTVVAGDRIRKLVPGAFTFGVFVGIIFRSHHGSIENMGRTAVCKQSSAIAKCLADAARSGPGFVKPLNSKKPGEAIVPLADMWARLKQLQENLSFGKAAMEQALLDVEQEASKSWPKLFSDRKESNAWAVETAKRIRCQARLIAQTQLKRPRTKWLVQLWNKEEYRRTGACESDNDADSGGMSCTGDEDAEEAEEELRGRYREPLYVPKCCSVLLRTAPRLAPYCCALCSMLPRVLLRTAPYCSVHTHTPEQSRTEQN